MTKTGRVDPLPGQRGGCELSGSPRTIRPPVITGGLSRFPGGVGRTTTPEDFTSLYEGVVSKIFDRLPDETWFYPGHGDDSTLGAERPHLAEWRERGW